jgi:hypothetical protein
MQTNRPLEDKAAQASDAEQAKGHGGNSRDAGPGAEPTEKRRVVGTSGHVPLAEEAGQGSDASQSASPGADADAQAGAGRAAP